MSFILDALKKSENERQRQVGPSLADIPVRRVRSDRPWWAVAVAALLVVNLGVLLVVLTRDRSSPAAEPTAAPQTVTPSPQPVVTAPSAPPRANPASSAAMSAPARPSPAVQSLAEAAGAEEGFSEGEGADAYPRSIAGAAAVPERPPVVRSITPPTVAPLPNQPSFAREDTSGSIAAMDEMLPTHDSLVAGGSNLPDMRLDIHVYSPNPRDRFVFVNMRKYTEGQRLSEGALLERITADGAILNQNGTRFLLPRQ